MSLSDTTVDQPAAEPEAAEIAATPGSDAETRPNLNAILGIPVTVQVVLGSTTMPVSSLMKMEQGSVIPLDQAVGEPVDIVINGRVIARGEVVVADEETSRFGVSLTELVGTPASKTG
ncbi:MAG TPA: flagellar motor switch protein FliN [Paracoccaceae bacterium]|nr:flagellar motor switch protein FliN [Paracoccaceae bacterium]